jgi:hypothetical protein
MVFSHAMQNAAPDGTALEVCVVSSAFLLAAIYSGAAAISRFMDGRQEGDQT